MLCFCKSDNGTEMDYIGKYPDVNGKPWSEFQCPDCNEMDQEEPDDCPITD